MVPHERPPDCSGGWTCTSGGGCRRPCGGLGGPQVFSRLRSLLCVQLCRATSHLPGGYTFGFQGAAPFGTLLCRSGCLHHSTLLCRCQAVFSSLENCTTECRSFWLFGTTECRTDDVAQGGSRAGSALQDRRRFIGPGPCGLGLPRIIAADFCAVNPPETVPHVPPIGGLGKYFCTKNAGCFLAKTAKAGTFAPGKPPEFPVNFYQPWGDYRGALIYQETRLRPCA